MYIYIIYIYINIYIYIYIYIYLHKFIYYKLNNTHTNKIIKNYALYTILIKIYKPKNVNIINIYNK